MYFRPNFSVFWRGTKPANISKLTKLLYVTFPPRTRLHMKISIKLQRIWRFQNSYRPQKGQMGAPGCHRRQHLRKQNSKKTSCFYTPFLSYPEVTRPTSICCMFCVQRLHNLPFNTPFVCPNRTRLSYAKPIHKKMSLGLGWPFLWNTQPFDFLMRHWGPAVHSYKKWWSVRYWAPFCW